MNPQDYPPEMKISRKRLLIIEDKLIEKNLWNPDAVDFGERWSYVARLYSELVYNIIRMPHPDEECMRAMGIEDEIPTLFKRVGLEEYYAKRPDTYLFQTMEFLCTFRVDKVRDESIGKEIPTKIRFYLEGNLHEMTLEHLNECFGTPIDQSQKLIREDDAFNREQFWLDISDTGSPGQQPYQPNNAKVSYIRNPVMRYLEKILQHSFFSRTESGSVNSDELYVMWCFLNSVEFNMAYYFVLQCERVIEKKMKQIYLGGMVTLICNHLGVGGHGNLRGDDLDISRMIRSKVLAREFGRLWYRQDKGPLFPLPNKKLTTVINTMVNLTMRTKAHTEAIKEAEVILGRKEKRGVAQQKHVRRKKTPLFIREEEEEEEEEEEDAQQNYVRRKKTPLLKTPLVSRDRRKRRTPVFKTPLLKTPLVIRDRRKRTPVFKTPLVIRDREEEDEEEEGEEDAQRNYVRRKKTPLLKTPLVIRDREEEDEEEEGEEDAQQNYVRRKKTPLLIREREEEDEEEEGEEDAQQNNVRRKKTQLFKTPLEEEEGEGKADEEAEAEDEMVWTEEEGNNEEGETQEEENMRWKAGYRVKYGGSSSVGWKPTEDEWEKSQKKQEEIWARQEKMQKRQEEMFELLRSMHEIAQNVSQWDISEGHLLPPPPPSQ